MIFRIAGLLVLLGTWPSFALGQELDQIDQDGLFADNEQAAARAAFKDGRIAFERGRFADALERFEHAYSLSGRSELLFNIGLAADRIREDERALEAFEQYLKETQDSTHRKQVEQRVGAEALFGRRLALVNGVIITGASEDGSSGQGIDDDATGTGPTDSGAGYAFARPGSSWSQLALIKAEPPETNDRYGFSVASDGATLLFGAPTESSSATGVDGDARINDAEGSGAVYVVR